MTSSGVVNVSVVSQGIYSTEEVRAVALEQLQPGSKKSSHFVVIDRHASLESQGAEIPQYTILYTKETAMRLGKVADLEALISQILGIEREFVTSFGQGLSPDEPFRVDIVDCDFKLTGFSLAEGLAKLLS